MSHIPIDWQVVVVSECLYSEHPSSYDDVTGVIAFWTQYRPNQRRSKEPRRFLMQTKMARGELSCRNTELRLCVDHGRREPSTAVSAGLNINRDIT